MTDRARFGAPLTTRQLEVLRLAADGLLKKQIAHQLELSLETVKTHQKLLRVKLGAHNLTHAVAIAFRRGLIADDEQSIVESELLEATS